MKSPGYIFLSCAIIIGVLFSFEKHAFCWDIIDLILEDNIAKEIFCDNKNNPELDFYFLPSLENKDFFKSINDLSICRNKYVRKYIYLYLTDGREYLTVAITRSNRYLKIVEDIFNDNKDIPADIALLPLLESAFNPYAISRSKAVGIWQILKGTSKALGLKINSWVDERRDIEKSTIAAISHLRSLYGIFGSWKLALAAYNGGAGHVKRAMRKSGSATFTQLHENSALKKETSEYIYRYAALITIYKNQKLFNIGDEIPESSLPETENITLEYPVKIQNIANITGVPVQILRLLNPELKQNTTPPYETKYSLILPKGSKEKLERNISSLYDIRYKKIKKHVVKEGECISRIAYFYKTEVKKIVLLNNLKDPDSIKPGLVLYIPI